MSLCIQKEALEYREKCAEEGLRAEKCQSREGAVLALLVTNPEIDVANLAERMSLIVGIIYAVLRKLKKQGVIAQDGYCGRWIVTVKVGLTYFLMFGGIVGKGGI